MKPPWIIISVALRSKCLVSLLIPGLNLLLIFTFFWLLFCGNILYFRTFVLPSPTFLKQEALEPLPPSLLVSRFGSQQELRFTWETNVCLHRTGRNIPIPGSVPGGHQAIRIGRSLAYTIWLLIHTQGLSLMREIIAESRKTQDCLVVPLLAPNTTLFYKINSFNLCEYESFTLTLRTLQPRVPRLPAGPPLNFFCMGTC